MFKRNLVVYDLETTGVDKEKDYIIQFAAVKVNKRGEIIDEKNLYIQPEGAYTISIQAYMKHHISPQFLADKPYFFQVADEIISFMEGCDILTYNGCNFDIPFLEIELKRCNKSFDFMHTDCYDAFLEEKRRNGISLGNTYKRYNNGRSMEEDGLTAHDALSDVKATLSIFKAQQKIQTYEPEKMYGEDNFIVQSEFNGVMQPVFNVGKYKELPLSYIASIDQGYLNWCVNKGNFMESTKEFIKKYITE